MQRAPNGSMRTTIRRLAAAAAAALAFLVVYRNWDPLLDSLASMTWESVAGSFIFVLLGLVAGLMSWRATLGAFGTRLGVSASAQIFFPSQLGKYAPGGIWPVVAQVDLARDHGVPKARSGMAALCTLAIGMVTSLVIGIPALLAGSAGFDRNYLWLLPIGLLALLVLHPAVLGRLMTLGLRIARRPVEIPPARSSGLLIAGAWSVLMWLILGAHCFLLALSFGSSPAELYLQCLGAFAVSWVLGFVVVLAPAGAVAREAALVVTLGASLSRTDALSVALVSRVLLTLGDLLSAGIAVLVTSRARRRPGLTDGGAKVPHEVPRP